MDRGKTSFSIFSIPIKHHHLLLHQCGASNENESNISHVQCQPNKDTYKFYIIIIIMIQIYWLCKVCLAQHQKLSVIARVFTHARSHLPSMIIRRNRHPTVLIAAVFFTRLFIPKTNPNHIHPNERYYHVLYDSL